MGDVSETIAVTASAEDLYALVSDLPRMGEWSPECTRVSWSAGSGPAVGGRFVGHNRVGAIRWFTFGRVVEAVPGRRFAFDISFWPVPISRWAYEFTPTGTGCEVSETWIDHRPRVLPAIFRPVFGDRTARNTAGIHSTLLALKAAAER
jgi:hypothetical protein